MKVARAIRRFLEQPLNPKRRLIGKTVRKIDMCQDKLRFFQAGIEF